MRSLAAANRGGLVVFGQLQLGPQATGLIGSITRPANQQNCKLEWDHQANGGVVVRFAA